MEISIERAILCCIFFFVFVVVVAIYHQHLSVSMQIMNDNNPSFRILPHILTVIHTQTLVQTKIYNRNFSDWGFD